MEATGTILIVDDEIAGQRTIEALLLSQGYQLEFASNGVETLDKTARLKPDLILLDIMMPGMDGYTVCQTLRANPDLAEIPILMLTALDDHEARIRGLEAGADEFLSKPFDRTELRARIRTIMRLNRYRKLRDEHTLLEAAHSELVHTYDATIEGWVSALDLRDKETEGHTQRVTAMTTAIARAMGIEGQALDHVRRGALLHDIGKLGIPDSVLLKPGKLTDEEWQIIKMHPVHAYEWLSPIAYLKDALEIPYCHHERWDGTGYPRGLAGEAIPLPARCFAVVDVWDALLSERPYKPAWTREQAIEYLLTSRGTHFDPRVVDAFIELIGGIIVL
jgi:putative two-component system response regulator